MSVLLWSLVIGGLFHVLSKAPAMMYMNAEAGGYDNRHPRQQHAQLSGAGARALAAHQNTLESFALFAAGILVAEAVALPNLLSSMLAVGFLVTRVLYVVCYVKDWATLRSWVWAAGYFACIGLMLSPWYAGVA